MDDVQETQIRTIALEALASSPIYTMRQLEVEQVGDSLVITGRVPTFYQKQMAQEIIRHAVSCELVNSIDVD